jgi:hypothetical protein
MPPLMICALESGKKLTLSNRPLLVIDGDSFAHRAYHALPKTILRRGRMQAGAIVGFANMLLRLYREEEPRAVLVARDTLEVPTYRHEEFAAYQSGREFDPSLLGHAAFRMRRRLASRLMTFSLPQPPPKKSGAEPFALPVETVTPSSSPPIAPQSFFPCGQGKSRASVLKRYANAMESILIKFLTSLHCKAIHLTKYPERAV